MKILPLLFLCAAIPSYAESDFHAYAGTEPMVEGGVMEKLSVVNGGMLFNIHPPSGWTRQMDDASRRIVFTSPSGRSALTFQFTTNSPGALPDDDTLRAKAIEEHPGAAVVQRAICPTSHQPGVFFDLITVPAPHFVQRIRQAFLADPVGQVELTLSTTDDEFDNAAAIFMDTARDFRVDAIKLSKS